MAGILLPAGAPPPELARCFVALWPDPAARLRLESIAREEHRAHCTARRIDPASLHLTLAFIGPLDDERAAAVVSLLAAIETPASRWSLDRIGSFAPARVLWAGGPEDESLHRLVRAVRDGLDGLGIAFDRKPVRAHVTLLREVAHAAPHSIDEPVEWIMGRPILARSGRDAQGVQRYRPWSAQAHSALASRGTRG